MICVAALLVVTGFAVLRYIPLRKKIMRIESRRLTAVATVAEASVKKEQLPLLNAQLQEVQKRVANFDANVPATRDLGSFLQQIAGLMKEHDLKDHQIQPGQAVSAEDLNCIPISMQCKGDLFQVFDFFKSLQELDRVIRIGQVLLRNASDRSGEVSMETQATIFYRRQPEEG